MTPYPAGVLDTNAVEAGARQARLHEAEAVIDPLPFHTSTAIANNLPLYTCNPDDFDGIEDLNLVALSHPDNRSR